jgi:hypothetical protein
MADPAHTFAQPHDVTSRLYELDPTLTTEILRGAVEVGLAARRATTKFHPPSFPGLNQWAETHRGLRERLVPLGWKADDTGGFSTVVNARDAIAITIAAGTDSTGRAGLPEPMTKYARGPLSHAAVEANVQMTIPNFPGVVRLVEPGEPAPKLETWVLLTHTHHDEVRIELSCPRHIGDDGRIDAWTERILIPSVDGQLVLLGHEPDEDPGLGAIDVPVEPR